MNGRLPGQKVVQECAVDVATKSRDHVSPTDVTVGSTGAATYAARRARHT